MRPVVKVFVDEEACLCMTLRVPLEYYTRHMVALLLGEDPEGSQPGRTFGARAAAVSTRDAADCDSYESADVALSDADRQILCLIAQGLSSREIGRRLYLSQHTIKHRSDRLRNKVGVSTRNELAAWAGKHGLYGPLVGGEEGDASPLDSAIRPLRRGA